MTDQQPEVVPPSSEPDAGVGTGSGGGNSGGATPPPSSGQSAGTGGIGSQEQQQGHSAEGGAPYDLEGGTNPTDAQSDSGT